MCRYIYIEQNKNKKKKTVLTVQRMIISERHCNYEVILIKAHWVVRFGELLDVM